MDNSAFDDPKLDPDHCDAMSPTIDYDYWHVDDDMSIVVNDRTKEKDRELQEETLPSESYVEETLIESVENTVLRCASPERISEKIHMRDSLTFFERSDRCRKRFKYVKMIGRESYGTLFKAYDTIFEKKVALKVVEKDAESTKREKMALMLLKSQSNTPRKHLCELLFLFSLLYTCGVRNYRSLTNLIVNNFVYQQRWW